MQTASVPSFNQPLRQQQRDPYDFSHRDFPTTMRGVAAGAGLIVKFFYTSVQLGGVAGAGRYENRLCVAKQPKGDRLTIACRYITEEQAKREFPVEFSQFKEYGDVPTTGTPLSELPGISMSQVGLLTINGLRSIEDLAELSDDQVGQLGLDAIRAHKTAKAWLQRKETQADVIQVAEIEARFTNENAALKKQLDGSAAQIAALEAQIAALQNLQGVREQPVGARVSNAGPQVGVAEVDADDGFEYDVSKMPDPFSSGPAYGESDDDLGENEPDILGSED